MVAAEFPGEGFPAQITDSRPFAHADPRVRLVLWQVKTQRVRVGLPPFTALDVLRLEIRFFETRRLRSIDRRRKKVELCSVLADDGKMKAAAKKEKNEAQVLDQATGNLLRAIKRKMARKQRGLDYTKLRKDGYSDRFLALLEEA